MSILPSLVSLVSEDVVRPLPMPSWGYGALAFTGFMVMLGVLWTFRNTAAKTGQGKDGHTGQDLRS